MKIIVISDVHLGSPEANSIEFTKFIKQLSCDRLILLGDIWDLWDMDVSEIRKKFSEINNLLQKFNVDYVIGNHDEDYCKNPIISSFKPVESLELNIGGRKAILFHGHQFDSSWRKLTQRISEYTNYISKKLFNWSFNDVHDQFIQYSKAIARLRDESRKKYTKMKYDIVIVGHTHAPEHLVGDKLCEFINCGDWKRNNTYIEIIDGMVTLKYWGKKKT